MFRLVKESADADENAPFDSVTEIETSTEPHKVYVHQPGVRNANEGGIKFYTHHLPKRQDGTYDIPEERNTELTEAIRKSNVRFQQLTKTFYEPTPDNHNNSPV
jgi:hypothetical protein